MDSDSLSNNICRRLVNFIIRTLRRPSSLLCSTRQLTVEEGSSRNPIKRPKGLIGSEIAVEFNHINGSGGNEHVGSVLDPLKDGLIESDESMVQIVLNRNGLQETESHARKKGLKRPVTIMESEKKKKKEGDQSASNQATMVIDQPHGETKPSSPRPHWPLLRVDTNINEKSDAYIERKKKDMGSLDPDQKS